MNARQKAKKYKKLMDQYKAEADGWKQYARREAAKQHETAAKVKTIHFSKLIPCETLAYMTEEEIKKEIASDLWQELFDHHLIRWKTEDAVIMRCKRFAGTVDILTPEEEQLTAVNF